MYKQSNNCQNFKSATRIINIFLLVLYSNSATSFPSVKYQNILDNLNSTSNVELIGDGSYTPDTKFREVIRFENKGYGVKVVENPLSAKEGTMSLWVKPLWNKDDNQSHTILSLGWQDPKKSYMALTYGWWEPLGKNRLYFILSNQEFVHCSLPYKFELNEWSFITAVWKSGNTGYCKLFVDGKKIAENKVNYNGEYSSEKQIFIGSDKGTTDKRERSSDFLAHKLNIYTTEFSEADVTELYKSEETDPTYAEAKKWKWMDETLSKPVNLRHDENGNILESRIIFDEDMHWAYSKQDANKILKRISEAGFNVYVPCVWHGNGTYYPSTVANPEPKLKNALDKYDPLEYLITEAHKLGIEVHPWFTVVRRENNNYPTFYDSGTPEIAYNVHKKEFRDFINNLMLEVVRKYKVDGINLDYIRTMGVCTSELCRENYSEKLKSNLMADYALSVLKGSARDRIQSWQDKAVTEIVEHFSTEAKKIRPNLIISVDAHPQPIIETRPLDGRDPVTWANKNIVDVIFNMDYNEKIDYEKVTSVRNDLENPDKLIVLFSNYDRVDGKAVSRSGDIVDNYVKYSRSLWNTLGVSFYIYNMLDINQVNTLKNGSFSMHALPIWPTNNKQR